MQSSSKKRPRVLVVYHYFAHYRSAVLRHIVAACGGEVEFASGIESNDRSIKLLNFETEKELGFRWKQLKNHWILGVFLWQKGLLALIARGRYDCVIFLGEAQFLSTWVAIGLCKANRIRVMFWTHGLYGKEGFIKKTVRYLYYIQADVVFLYGWRAFGLLAKLGMSKRDICVIYNSLDTDLQASIRQEFAPDPLSSISKTHRVVVRPERQLLFVGRLTKNKRLDLLLDAVSVLQNEGSLIRVRIIGDGPVLKNLRAHAVSLGLSRAVEFLGEMYDEQKIGRMIYESDLVVSPGNVGLTAMHAMGYGTPVCTHDNFSEQMPEFEAIIQGKTGFFFHQGDTQDLANGIKLWFSSDHDRARIRVECLGMIARAYNPRNQAALILVAVQTLVAQHDEL